MVVDGAVAEAGLWRERQRSLREVKGKPAQVPMLSDHKPQ